MIARELRNRPQDGLVFGRIYLRWKLVRIKIRRERRDGLDYMVAISIGFSETDL